MKNQDMPEFLSDMLGLTKKKPQSESEKLAQTFLDIAKKYPPSNQKQP